MRGEFGAELGLLVVASLDGRRRLGSEQLPTVEALADLAAISLERTDLLEAEGRRARDELKLKRAAEAISGSLDPAEVYVRVAKHAAEVTGATCALLTRLNARGGEVRTAATSNCPDDLAARLASLDSAAFGHVARTRTPLMRTGADAAPLGSVMHVPIELGPRLYGVLTAGHEEPGRFGEAELDLLAKLARSSAGAIANAIDFQRERRIARALTQGFVPESLPELPGYETGLLYAPAANEATGGDVYGAWPVRGGDSVAVLVGDVAGKGVETAALSAMVRFFIEARSWDTLSSGRGARAGQRDAPRAPAAGRLRDRLPRHPVARLAQLLQRGPPPAASSSATVGAPARQPRAPAGRARGDRLLVERAASSSRGDLVFAHTDGLIEARRSGEMYGEERLAQLFVPAAATHSPRELVRAVHEDVSDWADAISDDAVALALRRIA